MNRPLPHQLIQVLPVQACPPPLMPPVRPPEPPPAAPAPTPRARRPRRFRTPRALRDDAFWTGVLTALCIGGLLVAILATS
ncbi:hypothetical protein [Streptomyces sp. STR69]|uniref:hypothetical protein n=1 Tax=Streptomyces sp. STR69 TaxID=1796942 RepID=UPI0021C601BD|nr:hypothetical protein [Streptomyces sp. STR69]